MAERDSRGKRIPVTTPVKPKSTIEKSRERREARKSKREMKARKPAKKPVSAGGLPGAPGIGQQAAGELKQLVSYMSDETRAMLLAEYDAAASVAEVAIADEVALEVLRKRLTKKAERYGELWVAKLLRLIPEKVGEDTKATKEAAAEAVTIDASTLSDEYRQRIAEGARRAADLIKSIPDEYIDDVKKALIEAELADGSQKARFEALMKVDGMTERRAELMALDQTRKIYQHVAVQQMADAGITEGVWYHSSGGAFPRKAHKHFHGQRFDLSKGAPVGDGGAYVMPGEEPNCRCTFTPYIEGQGA